MLRCDNHHRTIIKPIACKALQNYVAKRAESECRRWGNWKMKIHGTMLVPVLLVCFGLAGCEDDPGLNRSVRVYNRTDEPITVKYTELDWLTDLRFSESTTIEAGGNARIQVYFDDSDDYLAQIEVTKGDKSTSLWVTRRDSSLSVRDEDFE